MKGILEGIEDGIMKGIVDGIVEGIVKGIVGGIEDEIVDGIVGGIVGGIVVGCWRVRITSDTFSEYMCSKVNIIVKNKNVLLSDQRMPFLCFTMPSPDCI